MRPVLLLATALSLLGTACSTDDPSTSATDGVSGTAVPAGTTAPGGTTASGGDPVTPSADSMGMPSGQSGSTAGGSSGPAPGASMGSTENIDPGVGGATSSGGSADGGAGGVMSPGESADGGRGGMATGGDSGSGATSGAAGSPGAGGLGGAAGMSGSGGTGGSGESDVEPSEGCGSPRTLENGTIDITFGGASRNYILRVPDSYDNSHPYRLVVAYAESGASASSVVDRDYFTMARFDDTNTIFVAPDAADGAGTWSSSDVELTDEILAQLEGDLCIDKTRIFATGFSFGGAMSLAVACQRADVFRGVAFFSGADLTGSCTGTLTTPIAYYASQASGDSSGDPIPSSGRIKQAQFAEVNGCTPEPEATTFPAPGEPHKCTLYQGCSAGHPTVYCVFDGPHGWEPRDPGEAMSWNAPLAWEFITQF